MAEMIKKYTRAEWSRLMAKLQEEDRTPYEDSPEIPAPETKPTPGAGLKPENMTVKEQLYFLEQSMGELEQALADAKAAKDVLTKTPEQILAEQKTAQEKAGFAPVSGAKDVGSAQARAEAADTAAENFGIIPQTQGPTNVGTLGTAQQQQQVANEIQDKINKRKNKYLAGIIENLESGGGITEDDVNVLIRGTGTGTNGNISGKNLFPPIPDSGGGASGPGASGPGASGPGASGPGASGPGVSGPGVSGPGVSGPGVSGPGVSGPGVSGPGVSGPGVSGPGVSGPGVSGPGVSGPGVSGPGVSGPGVSGPGVSGPGSFGPTGPGKPTGTPPAFIWDPVSGKWVMPPYPTDGKKYTWDDTVGWVDVNVIPGATGTSNDGDGRNLAPNTFKNTLALLFGPNEANQPWMDELFNVVSSYYKTGSSIEEATNLALRDARNNPNLTKFTQRFKAIFALEDMVRAGRPVYVPTIAEYVKVEETLGDVFTRAGLGDLADQSTLGDIIGTGKSVAETTSLITNVFNLIDNAPQAWKDEVSRQYPYATRTALAKSLLFGEKGAQELERQVQGIGVQAAARQQGLNVSTSRAQDIFAQGYGYSEALKGFGQVAQILPGAQRLASISRQAPLTQADVERSVFEEGVAERDRIEALKQQERARFGGSAGVSRGSLTQGRTAGML